MKRYFRLLTVTFAVLFTANAFAQELVVPESVKASFSKRHPKATAVKWKKTKKGNYRADYLTGSKNKGNSIYKSNGKFLVTRVIRKKPGKPIADYVKGNYAGYKVMKTTRVKRAKKPTFYRVRIKKRDSKKILRFSKEFKFEKEVNKKDEVADEEGQGGEEPETEEEEETESDATEESEEEEDIY